MFSVLRLSFPPVVVPIPYKSNTKKKLIHAKPIFSICTMHGVRPFSMNPMRTNWRAEYKREHRSVFVVRSFANTEADQLSVESAQVLRMVCHGSVCLRWLGLRPQGNCSDELLAFDMHVWALSRCEANKFIIFASSLHRVVSCDKMLGACVCAFSFICPSFMYNMCVVPLHMIAKYTSIQFELKLFQSSLPHFFSLFVRRTTISVCMRARTFDIDIFSLSFAAFGFCLAFASYKLLILCVWFGLVVWYIFNVDQNEIHTHTHTHRSISAPPCVRRTTRLFRLASANAARIACVSVQKLQAHKRNNVNEMNSLLTNKSMACLATRLRKIVTQQVSHKPTDTQCAMFVIRARTNIQTLPI